MSRPAISAHYLPGGAGKLVGAALVSDTRIAGVAPIGSRAIAYAVGRLSFSPCGRRPG